MGPAAYGFFLNETPEAKMTFGHRSSSIEQKPQAKKHKSFFSLFRPSKYKRKPTAGRDTAEPSLLRPAASNAASVLTPSPAEAPGHSRTHSSWFVDSAQCKADTSKAQGSATTRDDANASGGGNVTMSFQAAQ